MALCRLERGLKIRCNLLKRLHVHDYPTSELFLDIVHSFPADYVSRCFSLEPNPCKAASAVNASKIDATESIG